MEGTAWKNNSNQSFRYLYRLRCEGAGIGGGAIIFENETILSFSRQFLSVSISTNRAVYTGSQMIEVRNHLIEKVVKLQHPSNVVWDFTRFYFLQVRAIMLTTALQPYNGIADLFIMDPDGYTIRKWNSEELNVGVLSGKGTRILG